MTWEHEPPAAPPQPPTGTWEPAPPPSAWEAAQSTAPVPPAAGGPPPIEPPAAWGGAPTPPPDRHHQPQHAEPRRPRRASRVLLALVLTLGLFGLGFGVRSIIDSRNTTTIVRQSASGPQVATTAVTVDPGSEPVAYAAAVLSPSVVQIETTEGLGSGVVYDNGMIITNAHVVGSAKTVTVRNSKGTAIKGQVLGADAGTDVAVVQATGLDAPTARLASEKPHVGQIAVAIGSPYGLTQTVTSGIISAVNRPVPNNSVVINMIQTDASINPGNSGGALANRSGEVLGINSSIYSQTGENTGIGFAIPIATAKRVADQLATGRTVTRAGLGLSGPSSTPSGDAGAYVQSVTSGGAADKAGIRSGDTIVAVDGVPVASFDELRGLTSGYAPGDKVVVQVNRSGKVLDFDVTLGTLK